MEEEEMLLHVSYTEVAYLGLDDDDFEYTTDKIGTIYDNETVIGSVKFTIVHLAEAMNKNRNLFEIFDNHSDYLSRVGLVIEEHSEMIDEYTIDRWSTDVIVIESIELNEQYRGRDISVLVLKDILRRYNDAVSYFLIEAFPLNGIDLTDKEIKTAQTKLIKLYKKAGFKSLKGIEKRYLFGI